MTVCVCEMKWIMNFEGIFGLITGFCALIISYFIHLFELVIDLLLFKLRHFLVIIKKILTAYK
jgi:hypothetical protein